MAGKNQKRYYFRVKIHYWYGRLHMALEQEIPVGVVDEEPYLLYWCCAEAVNRLRVGPLEDQVDGSGKVTQPALYRQLVPREAVSLGSPPFVGVWCS